MISKNMTVQLIPVFPSPILISEVENFKGTKKELVNWIKKYQKTQDNFQVSGRNAWQSPRNFSIVENSFLKYRTLIEKKTADMMYSFTDNEYKIENMWINVNSPNGYNVSHTHPQSDLSAVLWINSPQRSGKLCFTSPNVFPQHKTIERCRENIKQSLNYHHDFWIEPDEGKIIIFPSNLIHFVDVNESKEDRISISFNINLI